MVTEVVMPRLGEGVFEGTVARWLKQEGEAVEQYEPLLEIETDKVTTEATAEVAGVLLKILVAEGETVPVDTILARIGEPGESGAEDPGHEAGETRAAASAVPPGASGTGPTDQEPAATRTQPAAARTQPAAARTQPAAARTQPARATRPMNGGPERAGAETGAGSRPMASRAATGRISPVVARIAGEHQVDLSQVPGSGRGGRITKQDILAYVEQRAAAEAAPEAPGPVLRQAEPLPDVGRPAETGELLPHSSIRRAIAEHMRRSKQTSPHVTTVFEVDFKTVSDHLSANKPAFARDNARLTYTAYLVAATSQALKEHPRVNSSWREEGLMMHRAVNIGLATALDDGLIVPVIKGADSFSLLGLSRVIEDLATRARQGKLKPDEVRDGTFTITNHGISGSLFATPIINQPQCGILGVGKIEKRVLVIDDAIAIRPLAYVSFTFDHRILDGAVADAFVSRIKEVLEAWR